MKFLLENGADCNFPDCAGWTPLHVAVQARRPYVCYILLRHRADVSIQNMKKVTALDLIQDQRIYRAVRVATRASVLDKDVQEFLQQIEEEEKERERSAKWSQEASIEKKCVASSLDKESQRYAEQTRAAKTLKRPAIQRAAPPELDAEGRRTDTAPFLSTKPISTVHMQHP